ncbi:hypothetical protein ABFS82_08G012100 [Erythranthe guttata]|nr:PREDICTED: CASP-like protein 4A1 [Erythranthe guttata]|eukprot:XP_012849470.1 PREDICTED: CASP-like protein 4A1 [Erythranthe guttata]
METQIKQQPILAVDSSDSPPHSKRNSGDHILLSPPLGSPENSPPGSHKQNSGGHISLSPPENSPARSSLSSDHTAVNHSPENKPPPPAAVVRRDVFKGPTENAIVLQEPMAVVNMAVLEEEQPPSPPKAAATKTDPGIGVAEGGGGSGRRRVRPRPPPSILNRGKREKMVKKAALGFRVFGFLFCLLSLSVMAADRNQGWAIDSFNRYKEFRYCISVNVIGFLYSGAQACDLSYYLATGKYIVHQQPQLRHYFDFGVDQIIAYLLISASSSATIRIDDWQLNWGKDKFPDMATASVSMSFLAFVALAANSLISGYSLCTSKSI